MAKPTRDEQLIRAALDMAADRLQTTANLWDCGHPESRLCDCARDIEQWGYAADEVRDIDPAEVLAKVGAEPAPAPIARLVEVETSRAWLDVMGERVRQITREGWTTDHDDAHKMAELAQAAACYALSGTPADEARYIHGRWLDARDMFWPRSFGREWWKPTYRRRDLVKAGALILAEIERLDRAAAMEASDE